MTGPEHYREVERLLREHASLGTTPVQRAELRGLAKVHGLLALAAATAMNGAESGMGDRDWQEWRAAVSAHPPAGGERP